MANPADDLIVIKKIKKGGHGHHGGAWKVAYADFVTAMMAFFLLLWLLSSTSTEQKAGIADYFTPTTGVKDAKGIGFQGGKSPSPDGKSISNMSSPGVVIGQIPQGPKAGEPTPVEDETPKDEDTGNPTDKPVTEEVATLDRMGDSGEKGKDADSEQFKKVEEEVLNAFQNTPELKDFKNNIVVTSTPEGLKIDMVDDQNRPMFAPGSALMTDAGKKVLKAIGDIVTKTNNQVALAGHTDASAGNSKGNYTNWELSADRANAARRYLSQNVVEDERIKKVAGMADQELLMKSEPNNPRNRRISLTLLRNAHIVGDGTPAAPAKGLLSVPDASGITGGQAAPAH